MAINGFYIPGGYYNKATVKCIECKDITVLLPKKTCKKCEKINHLIEEMFVGIEDEDNEEGLSLIREEEKVITEALQN